MENLADEFSELEDLENLFELSEAMRDEDAATIAVAVGDIWKYRYTNKIIIDGPNQKMWGDGWELSMKPGEGLTIKR